MAKLFLTQNRNKIKFLKTSVLLLIVLCLFIPIIPNTSSQTEPPSYGDWIISDTTQKKNCEIPLDGDLIIENGGSLTLINVKLIMQDLTGITVESGGSFYVYNSEIVGSTKSDFYEFVVYGTMRIDNSFVNETWGPDAGNMVESGIQILSDDVIISNSTISNAKETGIGIYYASPKILNCNIINNNYFGLIAIGSSSVIVDGCIIDNPFHNILFGENCIGTFSNSDTVGLILQDSCNINLNKVQMDYVTIQRGVTTTFRDSIITGNLYINENCHPVLLNTTHYQTKIQQLDETCSLTVKWNLNVKVKSNYTAGVSGATVQVRDNENGKFLKNFTTDNSGWVKGIVCTEYIKKIDTKEYFTPHYIIAKKGDENGNILIDIDSEKKLSITISNLTENYPPCEPKNILPSSTHNPTPKLTWDPSLDLNLDPITYHIDIWEGPIRNNTKIINNVTVTDSYYNIFYSLLYSESYYVNIYAMDDKGEKSYTITHKLQLTNQQPSAPEISITPTNPRTTDDITCRIVALSKDYDYDPFDKVVYTYKWYRNGNLRGEFTVTDTDELSQTIPSIKTQKDDLWKCVITPNDGIVNGVNAKAEITIINSKPIIQNPIKSFNIREDHIDNHTVNLTKVFKDEDNDPLYFYQKDQGEICVTINQETGMVTFEPDQDWNGEEYIILVANDSISEIESGFEITVTPYNDMPLVIHTKNKTVMNNEWLNFTISANDVDNDQLTFKSNITSENFHLNSKSGEIKFHPTEEDIGTIEVIISVDDNNGSKAYDVFYITVEDDDPGSNVDNLNNLTFLLYLIILFLVIFFIILFILTLKKNEKDQHIDRYPSEKPIQSIPHEIIETSEPIRPPAIPEEDRSEVQTGCPYCGSQLNVYGDGSTLCRNCGARGIQRHYNK
jgi:hypothetical protein